MVFFFFYFSFGYPNNQTCHRKLQHQPSQYIWRKFIFLKNQNWESRFYFLIHTFASILKYTQFSVPARSLINLWSNLQIERERGEWLWRGQALASHTLSVFTLRRLMLDSTDLPIPPPRRSARSSRTTLLCFSTPCISRCFFFSALSFPIHVVRIQRFWRGSVVSSTYRHSFPSVLIVMWNVNLFVLSWKFTLRCWCWSGARFRRFMSV